MTVRVATSDQSQSLTRSLSGSTTGSRKDGSDSSFGGVLSNVADDHAASVQAPGTAADKDGTGKKTAPNVAPTLLPGSATPTADLDSSLPAPTTASLFSIVALASDTAAAGTIGTKGKGRHADGDKAETADAGSSTAQVSPDAASAAGPQQVSLLALVQSAAASPSSSASEASPTTAATTSSAMTGAALSASSTPKDVSTPSLVSDITFQAYLSPVTGSVGQVSGGKQTSGSINPAASSSSKDGSSTEATTIDRAPGALPAVGSATATGGDAPTSDKGQGDTPSDNATTQAAVSGSGDGSADGAAPASGKAASSLEAVPSVSSQAVSPTIDVSAVVSGATLPTPLRSVADAVVSLAAQSAGSAQASVDSPARVSPARTMLLQLNPGDLGTVSVRLHLTGNTLDVSLSASKDQTTTLLDQGRDTLTRAIGDQNYQVNSLVIQRGDATSASGSSNATTDTARDQGTSHSGGGDASGGGSRQGADGSPARQDRQPPPTRPTPGTRGTGLFL